MPPGCAGQRLLGLAVVHRERRRGSVGSNPLRGARRWIGTHFVTCYALAWCQPFLSTQVRLDRCLLRRRDPDVQADEPLPLESGPPLGLPLCCRLRHVPTAKRDSLTTLSLACD
jgi:hypothetical protein